ncbi:MAG TPA: prohibitin family protein [Verrucomicrobiae bacterium]|nr:prohibitin family protein [Verrucomicrobiae bacterium]
MPGNNMQRASVTVLIGGAVALFVLIIAASSSTYVVEPGTRGIKVTLGKVTEEFLPEGFGYKAPFVTTIVPVNIRQKTEPVSADCFSSDLQQVIVDLRVLYSVPEKSVVEIYKQYAGDPFDSLIAPRVQEAIKEVTATQTAEGIVKNREEIKQKTLASARLKIGDILHVEDIVIRNIDLSTDLEKAIEAKMVAEQEAAQARFSQQQVQIEANTAIIKAKGDAEAIKVRGEALKLNPAYLRLQIVERWSGRSPLVVPAGVNNNGASLLLPLGASDAAPAP